MTAEECSSGYYGNPDTSMCVVASACRITDRWAYDVTKECLLLADCPTDTYGDEVSFNIHSSSIIILYICIVIIL